MIRIDRNLMYILQDKQHSDLWLLLVYQVCQTSLACLPLVWYLPNLDSFPIHTPILTHIFNLTNNLQEMLELNKLINSNQELAVLVHK